MIRAYRGIVPKIAASCYIDPSAQVIGDIEIGERSSVWCNVTIRGDVNYIRIGEETSIQDNSVIHVEHDVARVQVDGEHSAPPSHGGPASGYPTIIGNRVTVGHSVTLHGCVVEDECLIGIGAIVLNGSRVGKGRLWRRRPGSEGMQIPPGSLVMGVPGKIRRETSRKSRRASEITLRITSISPDLREEPS
jgi:carbonic anhydrase/acetyltransferase-like protein (isoleucine patch superfamily)